MLLSGTARVAGIMGRPVGHSLSPRLHGFWFEQHGIDGTYVPLPVEPEDVEAAFATLPRLGFRGWNVTIPHKEAAFRLVHAHDDAALRMGAVNTVMVQEDGHLLGANTDGTGFRKSLEEVAPSWRHGGRPATVLGAGGAARAVLVALQDCGVRHFRLVNRTKETAERLIEGLQLRATAEIEYVAWSAAETALMAASLLVNTTSLGMKGQAELELDLGRLPDDACVVDTVYVPLETGLLRRARARGLATVDGLGMLLHQAVPGFAWWGGRTPEVTPALRSCLLEALAAR